MFARMWRGFTKPGMADAYAKHLSDTLLPELRLLEGFRDGQLLRRELNDGAEIIVLTYWETMDSIRAFAGTDVERAVVAGEAKPLFREYDATVKHYAVDSLPTNARKPMPQNVYDDPQFFEGYSQFRRSREGLAGAPEWAALRSMLPPLNGARVLDLGCGFGYFSRWAADQGAASVLGIDLSEKMLARARDLTHDPCITYQRAEMESLDLPGMTFDLVYSSLALHYVEDYRALCAKIRQLLVTGGRFVFSVEHPLYSAPSHPAFHTEPDGRTIWPLDDYLLEGKRVTDWITRGIVKYHRTIESYIHGLLEQDFQLLRLVEWGPTEEQIAEHPEWANETHRPPFLLLAARAS